MHKINGKFQCSCDSVRDWNMQIHIQRRHEETHDLFEAVKGAVGVTGSELTGI